MAITGAEAVIGVDVGGSKTTMAVVYEGRIDELTLDKWTTPGYPQEFARELGTRAARLSKATGIKILSSALPGGVQWEGETPVSFGPLPNVEGFNAKNFKEHGPFDLAALLGDEVSETKKLEIVYFNDAHVTAQGAVRLLTPEGYTNDNPHGTILLSTGVGGEFLDHYRPVFRNRNTLGEYGWVGVGNPSVALEHIISGTAMRNRYVIDPKDLDEDDSPSSETVVKEVGEALALGFGNLIAVLNPDHISFAGSFAMGAFKRFGPYFDLRMKDIAWAGREHNLQAPELSVVTRDMVDELALRGTYWAYRGLTPISV